MKRSLQRGHVFLVWVRWNYFGPLADAAEAELVGAAVEGALDGEMGTLEGRSMQIVQLATFF